MLTLQRQAQAASTAAPVESGLSLEKIRFCHAFIDSKPPWKPRTKLAMSQTVCQKI